MFTVYIIQSEKDFRSYVGYTNNFERRFLEHNSGQSKATKHRTPFKLLFKEGENEVKPEKINFNAKRIPDSSKNKKIIIFFIHFKQLKSVLFNTSVVNNNNFKVFISTFFVNRVDTNI